MLINYMLVSRKSYFRFSTFFENLLNNLQNKAIIYRYIKNVAVAQLDRASGYEPEGCRFKSCQLHQNLLTVSQEILILIIIFSKNLLHIYIKYVIIYKHLIFKYIFRGVAHLVERVVWDHEVARSIRVTPTKKEAYKKLLFL